MERYLTVSNASWEEKTLSFLSSARLQHETRRLSGLRDIGGIFGQGSSRTWADAYAFSYEQQERGRAGLPEAAALRRAVQKDLKRELPLVSPREERLLQRMILFGGGTPLFEPQEYAAALSLIQRLWCKAETVGDGGTALTFSGRVSRHMLPIFTDGDYAAIREKMYALTEGLHGLLYLNGFLFADMPLREFMETRLPFQGENVLRFLRRFARAEFDFLWNDQGEMILVHPALADPLSALSAVRQVHYQEPSYIHQLFMDGERELLREEMPAVEGLRRELAGALRQEYPVEETVRDLRYLAKQGAPTDALSSLLSARMATVMTPRVQSALRRLSAETVRWAGVAHGVLN